MDRRHFLPEDVRQAAAIDSPLPIGYGQTNSQPSTVRMMLEWLDPKPGDKVLDVGSGSGWTSALLSYLVGSEGLVYAVERIPELVRFGRDNCKQLGLGSVHFYEAGDSYGLPECAPFDRILVSAAADELPSELISQLKVGGRMVIPIKSNIHIISKNTEIDIEDTVVPGFAFVPLV